MSVKRELPTGLKLAIDFGPLIIFFAVNSLAPGDDVQQAVAATIAFMAATAVAMVLSKWKAGHISTMLWVTGVVVAIFGGLTIYLADPSFIQVKPTIIYAFFASVLFFGLFTGRPLLKAVLEQGFPALDAEGWRLLTRNWALFFTGMAAANEVARANLSFDTWVDFKVWGVTAVSFLFAFSQAPILMRHSSEPTEPPVPPQG